MKIDWQKHVVGGDTLGFDAFIGKLRSRIGGVRRLYPFSDNKFKAFTRLPGGDPFEEEDSMAFAQEKFETYLDKWFALAQEETNAE
jgi:hypothetical protein